MGSILGWDEGIVGMQVGGERKLTLPPNMAYGKKGTDGIPKNSTLIFGQSVSLPSHPIWPNYLECKLMEIKWLGIGPMRTHIYFVLRRSKFLAVFTIRTHISPSSTTCCYFLYHVNAWIYHSEYFLTCNSTSRHFIILLTQVNSNLPFFFFGLAEKDAVWCYSRNWHNGLDKGPIF